MTDTDVPDWMKQQEDADDPWVTDTFVAPLPEAPTAAVLADIVAEVAKGKPSGTDEAETFTRVEDERLRPPGTTHLGAHVRKSILDYVNQSDRGWAYFPEIGEALNIDRSTALHHGTMLAKQGLAVLAKAKRLGQGGRPPKVLISLDRYEEIPLHGTATEIDPETGTEIEYEYVLTATAVRQDDPDTPARSEPGPLARALASDEGLTDDLADRIAEKLAAALLKGIANGSIRLTIEAATKNEEPPQQV